MSIVYCLWCHIEWWKFEHSICGILLKKIFFIITAHSTTQNITTKGEMLITTWGWQEATQSLWIVKQWRGSIFLHSRVQSWWTGGMRWEESELKECNIGGGVATSKSSQDGGPLRLLFYNIWGEVENRQVEPGGGWRWSGGEAFIFEQKGKLSLTGVCSWWGDLPSEVTSPWWGPETRFLTDGLKVKVNPSWRQSSFIFIQSHLISINLWAVDWPSNRGTSFQPSW